MEYVGALRVLYKSVMGLPDVESIICLPLSLVLLEICPVELYSHSAPLIHDLNRERLIRNGYVESNIGHDKKHQALAFIDKFCVVVNLARFDGTFPEILLP
jgi:hypothetical protein